MIHLLWLPVAVLTVLAIVGPTWTLGIAAVVTARLLAPHALEIGVTCRRQNQGPL